VETSICAYVIMHWISELFVMFIGQGFKIHTLVVDIQHCLQVLSTAICFYVGGKMFILVNWTSPNSIVSSIKALHLQSLG
jgi:hypothetical protein